MLKPSLAHIVIAAAMLKRGWLLRYLPEIAVRNLPESVPVAAGYALAGLMLVLALTNIAVAAYALILSARFSPIHFSIAFLRPQKRKSM